MGFDRRKRGAKYIDDNYKSVAEVAAALKSRGLNDCNLIVGIDFNFDVNDVDVIDFDSTDNYFNYHQFTNQNHYDIHGRPNNY